MGEPFFFDEAALVGLADERAAAYRAAVPFPHTVVDDLLPEPVLEACIDEFPGRDDIAWALYTDRGNTLKLATEGEAEIPATTRQLIAQLNGGPFVRFLERLTGWSGLVADPHLVGGGLHRIEPGGFLNVHADFNRHGLLGLERRINVLLYLNPGWQSDWGGALELWDRNGCRRSIVPVANRCVIFDTTDQALHGHPDPVRAPDGRARCSIALYYYSLPDDQERDVPFHSTLYESERPPEPSPLRARAKRWVPPAVADGLRRVRRAVPGRSATEPAPAPSAQRAGEVPADANHWVRIARLADEHLAAAPDVARYHYSWSVLHAADIARTLDIPAISALEFGCAGGNGLVALEAAAGFAEHHLGVRVDVHGFDTGEGLPPPEDLRDAPYLMAQGMFPMDQDALRRRLRRTELHLGLVRDTVDAFATATRPPVGFIAFDLDYYSSTVDAFRLFDGPAEGFLPRVLCYMDDALGYPWGDSNGERLAIRELNERSDTRVLDRLEGMRWLVPGPQANERWVESLWLAHILDHPRAAEDEGVALVTRLDLGAAPG